MISKLVSNTTFILILEKPGQQGGEAGGSDELVPSLLDLRVGKILDVKKVRKHCKPTLIRVRKKKRCGKDLVAKLVAANHFILRYIAKWSRRE